MRFDTPVYFQKITQGEYDAATGNYADGAIEETKIYAAVTDAGAKTTNLYYGEIKRGCKVIRIQNHYDETFNRIRIGDKQYMVDFSRKLRRIQVFIVSEV